MKANSSEIPHWRDFYQVLWATLKRFEREERRRDAAALTYTTLFALVPVITVSYSILSAIPALQSWGEHANQQLLAYVMPEGSGVVSDYLTQFSQQARKLTWFGVPLLFVTAFMLLRTIEMQFNRIWNVSQPRSGMQTFLRYWAVLSLGPLLFGAAFAVSSVLASLPLWGQMSGVVSGVVPEAVAQQSSFSLPLLAKMLPWLLSSLAVSSLYMLVPNCRVPWRNALIAAFLVASVFELAKFLFARIMGMFPSYQLIYGAFAAVPLFLLWVYLGWILLILGAELSFGLGHFHPKGVKSDPLKLRLQVVAGLLAAQNAGRPLTQQELEADVQQDSEQMEQFLQLARQRHWLVLSEEQELLWMKAPEQLPMSEFVADLAVAELNASDTRLPGDWEALKDWQNTLGEQSQPAMKQSVSHLLPSTEQV